jgi:endonuclease/exonuclease/phosphatase (EEP) superfamily protein YafD
MRMREMMNENGVIRARQADRIRVMMDESSYPLIVCGDFNDTPASYTYRKIKGDLEDSFLAAGKGYGYTYRYLRKLLRIDYLFYSPGVFRATRYYSPDLEYSDHKPVIVSLDVTPAPVEPEE